MAARHDARVWLALGTMYVVWGSTFIALAIVVRDLPPLLAMSARHIVAGGVLLAFALPRGDREHDRIGKRQIGAALVFGGLLFVVGHGSLAWAQQTVPAGGVAALLVGTIPIWIVLRDRVFYGRRLHASAYAGLVLGFVDLGFLFDPFGEGSVDRLGATRHRARCAELGGRLAVLARRVLPHRPLVSAGLASLCGGALLLLASLATGEIESTPLAGRAPRARLPDRRRELRRVHDLRRGSCGSRRSRSWGRMPM